MCFCCESPQDSTQQSCGTWRWEFKENRRTEQAAKVEN